MRAVKTIKHEDFVPHGYQRRAIEHLLRSASAAVWLDPGMGKTAVTLSAFLELQDQGIARKMLVIAPRRVCEMVWRQESQKWTHLRDIRFAMLAGQTAKKRKELLRADADVWLINPESVVWLCDQYFGKRLPFDTLCIDESTKFKNSQADRSKALQPMADKMQRRWELTGTPSPNGYGDLFGQIKMIDGGAALGRFYSHFRDRYFEAGRDGFSYTLRKGADVQIEAAIAPYVFRASADDYLKLPEIWPPPTDDNPGGGQLIELKMPPQIASLYKAMKNDMIVKLKSGGTVTAANVAAAYNKLSQMAGGAIYTQTPKYEVIHDLKINALIDLVDDLGGKPLLVAYAYGHERERICEALGKHLYGKNYNTAPEFTIPYLGGGVSESRATQILDDWNAGKLPLLICHPASAGHGLNMQLGNACHLCWFTMTWDYELYEQFIKRILRQGNMSKHVFMYKLRVLDTMDELTDDAVASKETTQDALLAALKSEILGEPYMALKRIGSPNAATQSQAAPAPAPQNSTPEGGGWGNVAPPQNQEQKNEIANKIAAPPENTGGGGWGEPAPQGGTGQGISSGAEERTDPNNGAVESPKTARTRRKSADTATAAEPLRSTIVETQVNVNINVDFAGILAIAEGDVDAALEVFAQAVKAAREYAE